MPLDNPMAYVKVDKAAHSKGKEKMHALLKRMMASKLKAKLSKPEVDEEMESTEGFEPESAENELPDEDAELLRALYEKLK